MHHTELERKERELQLIAEVSALISRAVPLRQILDCIAARTAELLETTSCAILLLTLDGRQLTIEGAWGLAPAYIDHVNRFGMASDDMAGLPSWAVCSSGRPMIWADLAAEAAMAHLHEAQRSQGLGSMIAVPLSGPDGLIGTLNCYHPQAHHFGPGDMGLLTTIGNHAATAIHNARLIERLSGSIRRLSELNEVISRQHTILARSEEVHRRLTSLVLEEQGLPAIVATLAGLLNCGISLYDQRLMLLTSAPPPQSDAPAAVCLSPDLLGGGLLNQLKPQQVMTALPAGPAVSAPAIICPIRARERTLGYLVAPDLNSVRDESGRRTLEHGVTVCAVELLKQRMVEAIEYRQRGSLLDDLLAGRFSGSDEIRRRAGYLGYRFDGSYRVMIVDADQFAAYIAHHQLGEQQVAELKQRLTELVEHIACRHDPRTMAVPRGERTVLVVPCGARDEQAAGRLAAAMNQAVQRTMPGLCVSVGYSSLVEAPEQLAGAHQQAQEALMVLKQLGAGDTALGYDELGICSLILRSTSRDELQALARRRLAALAAYNQRRGIDLIATLEAYLNHGCDYRQVAQQFQIHPNTVKHRLRLISQLANVKLDDTRQLLELQLALLIYRLCPQ